MIKSFSILCVFLASLNISAQTKTFSGVYIKLAECYTCAGYHRFEFIDDSGSCKVFLAKDNDILSLLKHDLLKAKNLSEKFKIEYRTTSYEEAFIGDCLFKIGTNELLNIILLDTEDSKPIIHETILKLKLVDHNKSNQAEFLYTFENLISGDEFIYHDKKDEFSQFTDKYINKNFHCKIRTDIAEDGLYYDQVLLLMEPVD